MEDVPGGEQDAEIGHEPLCQFRQGALECLGFGGAGERFADATAGRQSIALGHEGFGKSGWSGMPLRPWVCLLDARPQRAQRELGVGFVQHVEQGRAVGGRGEEGFEGSTRVGVLV